MGKLIKRTYRSATDGAQVDYALWLPPDYEAKQSWPLIVFLHGSGEGKNWRAPTKPKASVPVLGDLSDLPFVVAFPLMRGSWAISGPAERDVLETIEDVLENYSIDPDRVHLTGLSLGAFAGWRVATRYPDLFASLVLFSGGGEPDLAVNLRHLPILIHHGAKDQAVPVRHSRNLVAALREADIAVDYTEDAQQGHVAWRETYGSRLLYQWMSNQVRVRHPRRVSFRTYTLRHHRAYWVSIESMIDPSRPALVDAFIPPGEGLVLVHAENVGRLVLNPPPTLVDGAGPIGFVVNNEPVTARRADGGWVLDLAEPADGVVKRPGLSGPIQDVLYEPFVVAVASAGAPELIRRWQAAGGAGLAWVNQMVTGDLRVVPADQVTEEMMRSNHLICFGDASSHAVLGRMVGRLPLHAEEGRIRWHDKWLAPEIAGLALIYPNPLAPDRYLVLFSGVPEAAGRLAARVLAPSNLNPPPVEDVVLSGADGQPVLLEGEPMPEGKDEEWMGLRRPGRGLVFDARWRLTPEARSRLDSLTVPGP